MKNYSIVFKSVYTKDSFCDYLRKNYITFDVSGYYDNGYYVSVLCTPSTAAEIDTFLDSILSEDSEYI